MKKVHMGRTSGIVLLVLLIALAIWMLTRSFGSDNVVIETDGSLSEESLLAIGQAVVPASDYGFVQATLTDTNAVTYVVRTTMPASNEDAERMVTDYYKEISHAVHSLDTMPSTMLVDIDFYEPMADSDELNIIDYVDIYIDEAMASQVADWRDVERVQDVVYSYTQYEDVSP